jgi:hypothetical protein
MKRPSRDQIIRANPRSPRTFLRSATSAARCSLSRLDDAGFSLALASRAGQLSAAPQCARQYCTYESLTAVSCPSATLCATTDGQYLWVSTNPVAADATWTKSSLPNQVQRLYCPTDSLCLAASGAALEVTTDPVDAAPKWTAMNLPKIVIPATFGPAAVPLISGLSCVPARACVAVDIRGGYAFVGNPADPNSWTATKIDYSEHGDGFLTGVSCTPTGSCVAIDASGNAIVGTMSR